MDSFWNKVNKRLPDDCWLWSAKSVSGSGYGVFRLPSYFGVRKMVSAHRLAWCLEHDVDILSLDSKTQIRHRCDVRLCCNPSHLESGTAQDNTSDMIRRSGHPKGAAKLTRLQVEDIRKALALGCHQEQLAKSYKVCRKTIYNIKTRGTWS